MRTADLLRPVKGNKTEAAAALGRLGLDISRQAISQWGRIVPELTARRIHALTQGAVPLREEDYRRQAPARNPWAAP